MSKKTEHNTSRFLQLFNNEIGRNQKIMVSSIVVTKIKKMIVEYDNTS